MAAGRVDRGIEVRIATASVGELFSASKKAGRARLLLAVFAFLVVGAPAAFAQLTVGERATVASVVDGDTVRLESGREVRLVGIQAPKLPLGRPNFAAWPLADTAKAALRSLVRGLTVELRYGGRREDRHGRALAHLYRDDGLWVQGTLLERGLARVYSFRDNRALIAEMLTRERRARAARHGIWANPYYAVREAAQTPQFIDSFQLVEDRVLAVAVVRGRLYLNFGPDWRTDFTVSAAPRDRALFDREGFDYTMLEGRHIRVRGWLKNWNGPMIEVTHPEQIEVLP